MKAKPKTATPRTWYERIWDKIELVNTNPELAPFLDVGKFQEYQVNVTAKLIGQGMPLTPPRELKIITPEKLGRVLGQQCATLYELGKQLELLGNPESVSERSKPASGERMKTSHFEERIAFGAVETAQRRDESTQRELATFDKGLGGAWLVPPADCA